MKRTGVRTVQNPDALRSGASLVVCLCATLLITACGRKGNPLPPLVRLPAAPGDFAVSRIEDEVFVRFTVPTRNIDGEAPADVSRVEVYAITLDQPATVLSDASPDDLRELSTLVAATAVRRPLPPVEEGASAGTPIPLPPGVDQGAAVVVREALTPDVGVPAELPESIVSAATGEAGGVIPRALVSPPSGSGLQRHYFAVAVSPRGRYGPPSALVPAPLGSTSGPPSRPQITVEETSMTLRWTPPVDARGMTLHADADVLPSRPIVPGPPPTTYDVYEVPRNAPADAPIGVPTPLTQEPIGATEFTQSPITLGTERCFYVRAVDVIDGVHVRGPASPVGCAPFADRFAPTAASELVAVAVPGGVNLLWEPSTSKDVAGYLVLRGESGGDTLTAVTKEPVTVPSYRDDTVTRGTRYVYAVVAVDAAGNRSAESNRVEETAQ